MKKIISFFLAGFMALSLCACVNGSQTSSGGSSTPPVEEGNIDISKWHLERKEKNEYSTKQEITADVESEISINIELSDD